ncbi:MAG: MFS transporter [Acidimicrobiales bacterium]
MSSPTVIAECDTSEGVLRTYLTLTLLSTLATSFIWGVNTLFLLDAGLSNAQAFTVNAFFTAGQVLFEIPTGVVADTRGRRTSYLWGAATLLVATVLYVVMWGIEAPLWGWALSSIVIGLGFTFFSGAVEAWLVDALDATGYDGALETVFGRGQTVMGVAMLTGSVAGGVAAQFTNLGVPYVLRALMLILVLIYAARRMHDLGFEPQHGKGPIDEVKQVWRGSIDAGFGNPAVRWLMLAAPFTGGAGVYAFYAMQPHLLELYGDETAYGVAGLAAAVVAGAQIVGGLVVPHIRALFAKRTTVFLVGGVISSAALLLIGLSNTFWLAVALLVIWALMFSAMRPIRQAFINGCIPSKQRATVLSVDALMGSAGGVVSQPALGRAADVWSYGASYVITAVVTALALPFFALARLVRSPGDVIRAEDPVSA